MFLISRRFSPSSPIELIKILLTFKGLYQVSRTTRITFEAMNLLPKKVKGGNVAFKIVIKKAFNTHLSFLGVCLVNFQYLFSKKK